MIVGWYPRHFLSSKTKPRDKDAEDTSTSIDRDRGKAHTDRPCTAVLPYIYRSAQDVSINQSIMIVGLR